PCLYVLGRRHARRPRTGQGGRLQWLLDQTHRHHQGDRSALRTGRESRQDRSRIGMSQATAAHQDTITARTAVLLVNLGTPTEPTAKALRPYLSEFLSDPRVVEIPRLLWWPILHGIILRLRPAVS